MTFLDRVLSPVIKASPENPSTNLGNPDAWLVDWMGASKSRSGETVTQETALGLPAVWTAVDFFSKTFASLPVNVFKADDGEITPNPDNPISALIKRNPNNYLNSYQYRELIFAQTLLWGNSYSIIVRKAERASELIPVHPSMVTCQLVNGKIFYRIEDTELLGQPLIFDSSNILHVKNLSTNGVKGLSVISVLRENLGLGLAAQNFGSEFYGKGARLDGIVTTPNEMSKEGLDNLRASWQKTYQSQGGERVAMLDGGITYQAIGVPPEESQFLETRKFSVTDVARAFRVPPPLIYDLERATFSNISELILSFVKFSLTPWLVNFESEWNNKLLFESEKDDQFIKFNAEGLLRGDTKARSDWYKTLVQNGIMSPNEARRLENMNPYEGGDDFFMAQNISPINEQDETESNI